jgi:acyl-CoA synthetase (AMP-forming)/AMP-acid ligase II
MARIRPAGSEGVVRAVEFVDEIPRAPSGKVLRRVLVERDRQAAGSPPS